MTAKQYFQTAKQLYAENGSPETAQQQLQYMRSKFEFHGLKAAVWTALSKPLFKAQGVLQGQELQQFVRLCYQDEYREMQYLANEMAQRAQKKEPSDFIDLLEEMVRTKSWWDTVDWLAKLIGIHFKRFPEQILPYTQRWMASQNMWLQRCCLIFQLFYRGQTDTKLLFRYILDLKGSDEFFIQKAIGWALRQHSKTDADIVMQFINTNTLAPLSHREAQKWLLKQGKL